jgi:hypothetical protein
MVDPMPISGASEDDGLGMALEHARAWFTLHAGQRMQLVNFFLAAVAFLTAAYVAAFDGKAYALASAVALIGLLICVAFNRLEIRTRELVVAGEEAIRRLERLLAQRVGVPEVELIHRVETPRRRFTSYSAVIPVIQWFAALAYLTGAAYAFWKSR